MLDGCYLSHRFDQLWAWLADLKILGTPTTSFDCARGLRVTNVARGIKYRRRDQTAPPSYNSGLFQYRENGRKYYRWRLSPGDQRCSIKLDPSWTFFGPNNEVCKIKYTNPSTGYLFYYLHLNLTFFS